MLGITVRPGPPGSGAAEWPANLSAALNAFDDPADVLADTTLDHATVAAGAVIYTRGGQGYLVAASDATDHHVETVGGLKLHVLPSNGVLHADAFGCDPTGTVDCAAQMNRFLQTCAATGMPGRSSGTYRCDATITPGGTITWHAGETLLAFEHAPIENLTEILETVAGASEYSGTGQHALFDTENMTFSNITGTFTIRGSKPGTFTAEARATVPAEVVGMASTGAAAGRSSADMYIERLTISGCGYAFFQGDMRGSAGTILSYTRLNVAQLLITFCLNPWQTGESGNGFDDCWLGNTRIVRCAGTALIRGTDVNAGSFFTIGLSKTRDMEPQTTALTAGSTTAVLSEDSAFIQPGTVLAFTEGGVNKGGHSVGFVAQVTAKSGTTLTLNAAPEETVAAAVTLVDPPRITVQHAHLNCQHLYIEQTWDHGFELSTGGTIQAQQFKSSGGPGMAFRYGAPICITGRENCAVEISLHHKTRNSPTIKRIVAVGSQRDGHVFSDATVEIRVNGALATQDVNHNPVEVVSLWPEDLSGIDFLDASGEHNPLLNLSSVWAEGTVYHAPYLGRLDTYLSGPGGGLDLDPVADFATATAQGNVSIAGGLATKNPGAAGRVDHLFQPDAGAVYRVTVNMPSLVAGGPELRWQDTGSPVGDGLVLGRAPGRYKVFFQAPANTGAIDRLSLFGFAGSAWTCDEFTIERVPS